MIAGAQETHTDSARQPKDSMALFSGIHPTDSTKQPKDSSLGVIARFSIPDSVIRRRKSLNQTNSTVLLAWAGANIVQGSISAGNLGGSGHYFHQMNAYFNIVNLALAGYGLYELRKQVQKKYTLYENLKEQNRLESLLLLNTGLDAAYISTGLYLQERGNNRGNDQTKGYGGSLILQGSFCLYLT